MNRLPKARQLLIPPRLKLVMIGDGSRSDERKSGLSLIVHATTQLIMVRKHRERKENHCRMLEDELYRLYHLITMEEELQTLRVENGILRDIMVRHSIPLPLNVPLQEPSWAEVTFTSNGGHDCHLQVKLPDYQFSPVAQEDHSPGLNTHTSTDKSSKSAQSAVASTECPVLRYGEIPTLQATPSVLLTSQSSGPTYYHSGVNLAQMGVDFVLS